MTDKELLNQALEYLEDNQHWVADGERHAYVMEYNAFIDKLKQALAQPDQYAKGYADAMNWKVQNHLEHLPVAQKIAEWKLVPRDPTNEMLKAMDECSTEGYDERLYAGHAASVYMAAVDVAPTPPQRKPLQFAGLSITEIRLPIGMTLRFENEALIIEAAHNIKENT